MPLTIDQALQLGRSQGLERTDALALLAHILQLSRAGLIAHGQTLLSEEQNAVFIEKIHQRLSGIPIAYIVGQREFYGMNLHVTADVLDPRADTETLVDWALSILQSSLHAWPCAQVLDMGTGSGAIALAIAQHHPSAQVTATDYSEAALAIAQHNALVHQLPITFHISDWWSKLQGKKWHLIVSNPPYIALDDPHLPALQHEPALALTSGKDGLDAIREIIALAPVHLTPGGWLVLEHGYDQAHTVAELLHQSGFQAITHRHDISGICRCSGGQWVG
jgi:release factor glutamine methyltransferase